MSIPKKIHYCWFGHNPKPKKVLECIESWRKKCPSYQIIEWNEDNVNINDYPLYVRQAYEARKWAFVTDYVRLNIIYENGGIYLDTDVELKKNLDKFLGYNAFFGFEDGIHINTGLGFGSIAGNAFLKELMDDYLYIPFILPDGSYDIETCPKRNTKIFLKYGLKQNDRMQELKNGIKILPSIYMCPISYETERYRYSFKTISVHWFASSWMDETEKEKHKIRRQILKNQNRDYWIHLPNRFLINMLGEDKYYQLKTFIKRGKK